jgi:hypothetical protein
MRTWLLATAILGTGLATVGFFLYALGLLVTGHYEFAWYATFAALALFALFRTALHLMVPRIKL